MRQIIDTNKLPKHIAITMDGNGRWAKAKGKLRAFGHKSGIDAVRDTIEGAAEIGIKFLTLYAFSTENWERPKTEVKALMSLLISAINKETRTLMENDIKLIAIGNTNSLPSKAKEKLIEAIKKTENNKRMTLVLALSYSGRWDILNATKKIINKQTKFILLKGKNYLTELETINPQKYFWEAHPSITSSESRIIILGSK